MRKTGLALVLFLLLTLLGSAGVSAQSASNLLVNGGLEEDSFGPYLGRRGGTFPIYLPNGWYYWLAGPTGDRYNTVEKTTIQPHPGPGPDPREGRRALDIDCGFFTCTAAIYQQVNNIQPNTNVQASAFAIVKACDLAKDASGKIIAPDCGSAIESGAKTRIGIDPNGGIDPNDTDIVWSAFISPHIQNGWQQMTVSATATGSTVTLFLYSTQSSFADINKTYWDQVTLSGGGSGGAAAGAATAVPTAPPVVPFVVPQGQQDDGSIVHTVQPGDTIDSIAYAYGVSRTTIMELNNIKDPRIIQLGQKLLIKPAQTGGSDASATTDTSASAPTPETQPTADSSLPVIGAAPTQPEQVVQPTQQTAETQPDTTQPTAQSVEPQAVNPQPTGPVATAPVVVANAGALDPASTTASVCVTLFNDADQNRIQEQGEDLLKGGTISIQSGSTAAGTYETDGVSEPHCFEGLQPGEYTALASAPDGFGLTTPTQLRLLINPGTVVNVSFGAAQGVQPVILPTADAAAVIQSVVTEESAPQRSIGDQLLSISGLLIFGLAAVVLVGGVGIALFMRRR